MYPTRTLTMQSWCWISFVKRDRTNAASKGFAAFIAACWVVVAFSPLITRLLRIFPFLIVNSVTYLAFTRMSDYSPRSAACQLKTVVAANLLQTEKIFPGQNRL